MFERLHIVSGARGLLALGALCVAACGAGGRAGPVVERCDETAIGVPAWEPTAGPVGTDRATTVFVHGDVLLLATWDALLRSADGGATWTEASGLASGRIGAIVEGDGALVATLDYDRLVRSDDAGRTWRELPSVGTLLSLASDGERLFAAAIASDRPALLRSDDGGESWVALSPLGADGTYAYGIFAGSGLLLAPSYESYALYRSADGGASWQPLRSAPEAVVFADAYGFHEGSVFAFSQQDAAIYRSADDGATWTRHALEGAPFVSFGGSFFADGADGFFAGGGTGPAYRWDAPTGTWLPASEGLGPGFLTSLHGGAAGTYALVEDRLLQFAGGAWREVAGLVRTRVLDLAGGDGSLVAIDAYRRLQASADGGRTWRRLDSPGESGPAISAAAVGGGSLWAGTAGQGVFRSDDAGATWQRADGGYPTYAGPAGTQHREVAALVASAGSLFVATGGGYERTTDPFDPVHMTGAGVWRSDDGGTSWMPARDGLPARDGHWEPLGLLAEAGGALFAGGTGGGLFRSLDAGTTWEPVGAGLPSSFGEAAAPVVGIAALAERVFAHVGEGGLGALYASADGGLHFTPAAAGELATLAQGEGAIAAAFRGADGATWIRSTVDGESWQELGTAQPPAPVRALLQLDGVWFAATEGRGVWRLERPAGACRNPH